MCDPRANGVPVQSPRSRRGRVRCGERNSGGHIVSQSKVMKRRVREALGLARKLAAPRMASRVEDTTSGITKVHGPYAERGFGISGIALRAIWRFLSKEAEARCHIAARQYLKVMNKLSLWRDVEAVEECKRDLARFCQEQVNELEAILRKWARRMHSGNYQPSLVETYGQAIIRAHAEMDLRYQEVVGVEGEARWWRKLAIRLRSRLDQETENRIVGGLFRVLAWVVAKFFGS